MSTKENGDFMIEEYRNIAATHDKLRDINVKLFNYFLIFAALPFTAAGVISYKNVPFNLSDVPDYIYLLFLIIGIASFMLGLSMLDARLGQYRYAKAVNVIRKYFIEQSNGIKKYLYLPSTHKIPDWSNLGWVGWQISFIMLVGGVYTAFGFMFFKKGRYIFLLVLIFYIIIFYCFQKLLTRDYRSVDEHFNKE